MAEYKSLDALRRMTDKEVNALFRKEWKNFRRRMERMAKDDVLKNSPIVQAYKNKDIVSQTEARKAGLDIRAELNQLLRYSTRKTSTFEGARKSLEIQVTYYREKGYTWITPQNVYRFQAYLDELRMKQGATVYDSDEGARLFGEGERLKINTTDLLRHYDEYASNLDLLETRPDAKPTAKARTIKDVRRWKFNGFSWERD